MPTEAGVARLAPVKVNLTLHVGARRADGYHEVDTVCAFPAIGDLVSLGSPTDDWQLDLAGPFAGELSALDPEDNLIVRAARLMQAAGGATPRRITLYKRVPAASGIAGGTADAAATLALLNEAIEAPLPRGALLRLALRIGADGPVCLAGQLAGGGAWRARGIGERLTRLPRPAPAWMVLANPRVAVPTGRVFAGLSAGERSLTQAPMTQAPTRRSPTELARAGRNDLRGPAIALCPQVATIEAEITASPGCLFARMSGSGATVFGLFSSAEAAARAARRQRAAGRWAACAPLLRG